MGIEGGKVGNEWMGGSNSRWYSPLRQLYCMWYAAYYGDGEFHKPEVVRALLNRAKTLAMNRGDKKGDLPITFTRAKALRATLRQVVFELAMQSATISYDNEHLNAFLEFAGVKGKTLKDASGVELAFDSQLLEEILTKERARNLGVFVLRHIQLTVRDLNNPALGLDFEIAGRSATYTYDIEFPQVRSINPVCDNLWFLRARAQLSIKQVTTKLQNERNIKITPNSLSWLEGKLKGGLQS
jgi:hypothetical protein